MLSLSVTVSIQLRLSRGRVSGIPEVWLIRWRNVIGANIVASKSGKYLSTQSSIVSNPIFAIFNTEMAVNCFEIEAILKRVSASILAPVEKSATPRAFS